MAGAGGVLGVDVGLEVDHAGGGLDRAIPQIGTMISGPDEARKQYALHMNSDLKVLCSMYGFTFIDVYEAYSDEEGFLNRSLSDGQIHIGDPKFLYNYLKQRQVV